MRLNFTKMHALGNDFMVVAGAGQPPAAARIRALADRRTGVGFDQLLWVEPAPADAGVHARYRSFNADGSEAEQCGNGARCIARFLADRGEPDELVLAHAGGRSPARILADGSVTIALCAPDFRPAHVPFQAAAEADSYTVELPGERVELRVVSIGNPHGVLRVADVAEAPVARLGAALERHERFPNRANIGFMQVVTSGHVQLRVFERGVGETRACGTGACAAAVVGRRAGWLDDTVRVDLPGGSVTVSWKGPGEPVWLTGEAITVFEGTVAA